MLEVRGQRLRVLIRPASAEPRRPVVFLNGIACRADVLDALVDAFDPTLEVVRIDPPGIGSTPMGMPYGIPQMADWVTAVLDQLGYQQVDVIGYSWGGVVAQQLAVQADQRVRRLVLLSTNSGFLSIPGSVMSTGMLFSRNAAQVLHDDDEAIGRLYGGCARRRAQDVRRLLGPNAAKDSSGGLAYQLLAAMTWTTLPLTPLIHQPTLILAGTDDPMVPFQNAEILHRAIVGSWLHPFDGGHLDPLLEPRWCAGEVSRFLTARRAGVPD